ncbi:ShlB/FhaC/HecB family hemolysin secretion/activation protein [Parahaliea aestuarii]|uniref:ShlB/FhaC/HecB family hemolysin secretion/activation protein n=1 Tax=Parahaliea aestuarii TaxID=1852021 RepID=A0A5C8ZPC6_9GAMM|nr:ShlB/FhaC/HecB family hemolysin secretion/activation protein [Parahaliea aestuarii]TXS90376.1 ShlB/FhaC/HecB family hemolysin secretion/activation protein [Parahaliea aestuarii]
MQPAPLIAAPTRVQLVALALLTLALAGPVALAQSPPPAGSAISSFRDNVGRGFSDAGDPFAEPGFNVEAESASPPVHRQVLPAPGESATEGSGAPSPGHEMRVSDIVVEGNTVIPAQAIASITEPFANRTLSPEQLRELQRRLSLLYYNAGYVNSGVVLPDPLPGQGTLRMQAIEGQLRHIALASNGRYPQRRLEARLRRDVGQPLNVYDLQDSLLGLELNPLIRKVNAALVPGLVPGEADLQLQLDEARAVRLALTADNYRSPSVGAERGVVSLEHLNLTGQADRLAFAGSASEGLNDAYIDYTRPLGDDNTRLWMGYRRGASEVVEAPFDDLDIESDTESWGVALTRPLVDQLQRSIEVFAGLNYSHSETDLLGKPFSFSLGARDGEITATNASIGAEWIERGDNAVLALRSSVRYGLDWFGATIIPGDAPSRQPDTGARIPESRFTALLTQFQYARRMPWLNSQLVFSGVWQQAFDPLLSVEKMAIGGVYSVRGFRENQLVRDSGLSASLEWRVPLFTNDAGVSRWNLTAIPFVDYGRSWDYDDNLSTHNPAEISSIGLGLRWLPTAHTFFSLYYGERIADDDIPPPPEDDLQDEGFHIAFGVNWPLW